MNSTPSNTLYIPHKNIFLGAALLVVVGVFASSYIQTESLTRLYRDQISSVDTLCPTKSSDLKFLKIIAYDKSRKELILQCIYKDGHQNSEVVANLISGKWTQVRVNRLNERGGLYWPIYL